MIILDHEQGTEEWFKSKLGVPSASNFSKIICKDKKGAWVRSSQAKLYMYKLAAEIITEEREDTYKNNAMDRGNELESLARLHYEMVTGYDVTQVGFCLHDTIKCGCSPDGLINPDGGLEIKCGIGSTQVKRILEDKLPSDYFVQVQGSLFVSDRKWWDFEAYHPKFKSLIVRVCPDLEFHEALKFELTKFNAELDELVEKITC